MDILHEQRDVRLYTAWLQDLRRVGYSFPILLPASDERGFEPLASVDGSVVHQSDGSCEQASTSVVSPWSTNTSQRGGA